MILNSLELISSLCCLANVCRDCIAVTHNLNLNYEAKEKSNVTENAEALKNDMEHHRVTGLP